MHQIDPENRTLTLDNDSLYPYENNYIKYRLFEDIVDSYFLWHYTILWITHISLPTYGYGHEHESTNLATVCRFSISR